MMKVKVVFGEDVRRCRDDSSIKYESLKEFIKQSFDFVNDSSFTIQYEDDENDKITIGSQSDFNDALTLAEKEERKSLKLFVNVSKQSNSDHSNNALINGESDDLFTSDGSSSSSDDSSCVVVESPRMKGEESNCSYWYVLLLFETVVDPFTCVFISTCFFCCC